MFDSFTRARGIVVNMQVCQVRGHESNARQCTFSNVYDYLQRLILVDLHTRATLECFSSTKTKYCQHFS